MFDIMYTDTSLKQLKKLPKTDSLRILNALERIRIRPIAFLKKLVGNPFFRLRVGDYRVIVDLKNKELIVLVLEVGKRSSIYKK